MHSLLSNFVSDSDVCPAVMDLSTNCAFTDRHGILLDEEARNLCNRHEMCYKCVSITVHYFSLARSWWCKNISEDTKASTIMRIID